jgi:GTP pyrophosphokinase
MEKGFQELLEKVLSYHSDANTELLKEAYTVAADAHLQQTLAVGGPYITHLLKVADMLAGMKMDDITIAAGLLQGVVEDSNYTPDDIARLFGKEISDIVWGVTKIATVSDMDKEDARAETLKKLIIAMTNDVRVILIKLADRYHQMQVLDALPGEDQKRVARETLDIYAPIAHRLGMGKMKTDMEDIAFRYAFPEEFKWITIAVNDKKDWAVEKLDGMKKELQDMLKQYKITGVISSGIKREVSIYRKLERLNMNLDHLYDLLNFRIITDSIENCYALMGEIHQRWTFIPARMRDFIANPKSNGYQSIHTTVMTKEGVRFEIRICTNEMYKVAEEGIVAHWKYKEGVSFLENDRRLWWFRDMIEMHIENPDPIEFLSLVKRDLTPNEIPVFTPKGKVINLKKGATPIDFAYAIHSEVGEHLKAAIVNENRVPLKAVLNSGDVVEIITHKNARPTIDWLKYAVTNRARRKIMNYIQKKEYIQYQEKGKRKKDVEPRLTRFKNKAYIPTNGEGY